MTATLRAMVRTPHEVVLDLNVRSARFPTETGQVGVRPRGEPLVLAVEAGLILFRAEGTRLAASAGGLLESDRERCTLYTPFAVVGTEEEVLAALDRALATPDSELAARRSVGELERRILSELRDGRGAPPRAGVSRG
ncbi:MAG TPA: hypothetical protein VLD85_11265 [Anaeromyxobacteraceae bacterium]|nr:hypothetical protein [Anaeromyxobacteraceae bacterium]